MACRDHYGHLHPFCYPETSKSDGMRRPSWSFTHVVFESILVSFSIQRRLSHMARRDILWSSVPFTFQRRQCLQSLHAFKWRQCPRLHFEDDNIFSHCMPSKGDNVFMYILKTIMSSVIACLLSYPNFVRGLLFDGMQPLVDHFEVLGTLCCTMREVLRHAENQKEALLRNP